VVVSNLRTQEQLKIKLIDSPPVSGRTCRLRVNGKRTWKVPVGSNTTVLRQLGGWWVTH
jgi:hypothetical protein